jgi:hypothetical protein
MRHPLYKYFSERKYATSFLENGEMLFRPLAYVRDIEDATRGNQSEGISTYKPPGGLEIHNQTTGQVFMLDAAFESSVRADEFLFIA